MEPEIVNTLQEIRAYVFIIMVAIVIWVLFRVIESAQRIFFGFRKNWVEKFNSRMVTLIQKGDYDLVILECRQALEEFPNNLDTNWFIAKAYFHQQDTTMAKKHFNKVIQLEPSWQKDAQQYLDKLDE